MHADTHGAGDRESVHSAASELRRRAVRTRTRVKSFVGGSLVLMSERVAPSLVAGSCLRLAGVVYSRVKRFFVGRARVPE